MSSFKSVSPPNATIKVTPFKVAIPDEALEELQTLLKYSKLGPVTYESVQQDRKYGVTHDWLRNAKDTWQNKFNWRKHEEFFNSFSHFTAPVADSKGDFNIHFTGLFSSKPDAIPLLCLHGWPGSFLEFLPIMDRLRNNYSPSTLPYHIIVPSLPGYTFSSPPPSDRDFRVEDIARVFNTLMLGLGFPSYIAQGGDIGSKIARVLAAEHTACKAAHINFCIIPRPSGIPDKTLNALDRQGVERAEWFHDLGSAYALLHATKPSTIGLVLSSSPLALLAWIGEKFLDWTDEDPPLDTILKAVTLYWLTDTFPRSIYPYRQLFTPGVIGAHEKPAWHMPKGKPFGYSWFPKEIAPMPKSWVETTGEVTFYRQHEHGGHFAAVEQPDVLLKDIEEFVAESWPKVQ